MRFSVNTLCLFPGYSLEQALEQMLPLGYDTFELWSLSPEQPRQIQDCLRKSGAHLSAFCPSFFILNDPARREEYLRSLQEALETAKRLDCPGLITQVGQDTGAPRAAQHQSIVEGLRAAAPLLEQAGVTLLVEPLNDVKDHPGYYLTDSNEGFDIIRQVNSPNVRLLFDIYHQVHMGEDVLARIRDNLPLIGHFHVAGHPRRDDKLFENFDYDPVFRLIAESKVQAPVGLELFCPAEASLALLKRLGAYLD